jgi:acyl carrier protein
MMTPKPIYEKLTEIFHEVFEDDTLILRPDMTAEDVPEWDNLSHVRLVLTIQRKFGVTFSAAQTAGLKNVGELVSLLQTRVRA